MVSQIRTALAERERKLGTYRLQGTTIDAASGQQARFRFMFRAPNQMRGELLAPTHRIFAFDGHNLSELAVDTGVLTHWDLAGLDRAHADSMLHQVFAPFAPEGFRAPLMPTGPEVRATSIDRAGATMVRLSADLVEGGEEYFFAYELRPPAMDLLREETRSPAGEHVVEVLKERCDPGWGFCLPEAWVEKAGTQETAHTVLDAIDLNPPLSPADIALAVPDGGREETQHLAMSGDGGTL